MQTQKLLDIQGDDVQGQILALRSALRGLQAATTSVSTRTAQDARTTAHTAYLSSFSTKERAVVLKAAHARNPDITTYEDALMHFGTSFLVELQSQGLLTHI